MIVEYIKCTNIEKYLNQFRVLFQFSRWLDKSSLQIVVAILLKFFKYDMMNYVALIFILYLADIRANLIFKAKFMGNWRVTGDSIVLHALSVSHCLAMCNKNATCDAITFQDKLNKCQLFKRCMPLRMVHKSTHHWFYAKRPPSKLFEFVTMNLKNHIFHVWRE